MLKPLFAFQIFNKPILSENDKIRDINSINIIQFYNTNLEEFTFAFKIIEHFFPVKKIYKSPPHDSVVDQPVNQEVEV